MNDMHRKYSKVPDEPAAKAARQAYEREQKAGEAAAKMVTGRTIMDGDRPIVVEKARGGRIITDWLGYRFVQLASGTGVLFRRTRTPHGFDEEIYDNGKSDPEHPENPANSRGGARRKRLGRS